MKGSLVSRDSRHHTIQRAGVAGGRAIIKGLVASLSAALALLASPGASGIVQGHAQDNFFLFASPALGATYLVGESISVDWACNPEIFIECSSSPSGDALSFSLPGTYTFTLTGSLGDGVISETIPFVVTYGVCRLDDASKAVVTGKTVTVKLALCDANGNNVSAAGTAVTANSVVNLSSRETLALGSANNNANFKFDSKLGSGGGYAFTFNTTGLAPGNYQLGFLAANDIVQHLAFVMVVAAPPLPVTGPVTTYAGSIIGGLPRLS
ncbi:MAG: hypothetical protein E6J01_17595 [Chloroflexi bacterium]|nr:MAG: hypothetical protein E6J01_17595 [Chloroflexota bacterium]